MNSLRCARVFARVKRNVRGKCSMCCPSSPSIHRHTYRLHLRLSQSLLTVLHFLLPILHVQSPVKSLSCSDCLYALEN